MPVLQPRNAWTNRIPGDIYGEIIDKPDEQDGLPNFNPNELLGIAVHWTGIATWPSTVSSELNVLRRVQNADMDTKRYSDIMYNLFVSRITGDVYEGRGLINKGAANGSPLVNARYLSVLLCMPTGGPALNARVTEDQILGVRLARQMVLAKYPKATAIVGHNEIRPGGTSCPGLHARQLIADGTFLEPLPPPPPPPPVWTCPWTPVPLQVGSVGAPVFELQGLLAWFHFYAATQDGVYGPVTAWGVASLQNAMVADGFNIGKPTDGIYDAQTRTAACWWTRWLMDTGQNR